MNPIPAITCRLSRLFLLAGVALVALPAAAQTTNRPTVGRPDYSAFKVIADRNIREPIFCPDLWGGYLIYRLYPQTKVLVDDRHDLYGDQFFKDYLKVVFVQPDWSKVLEERHVDWVLVEKNSSLGTILEETPQWKLIHQDATAMLFHRQRS